MKLLFDHNLSPYLVDRLADLFPDSTHIFQIGLDRADDIVVWTYAFENDYIIVTKDADFSELIAIRGSPPKLIWIRLGNCTTKQVESVLRLHFDDIRMLNNDLNASIMMLF